MALVPFPAFTETDATVAAIRDLTTALGGSTNAGYYDLQRTARAVSARIQRYAPDAPQDVKDEALIRAVGWLMQSGKTGEVVSESLDVKAQSYDVRVAQGWFRHSSAMSLLSPWRVRNAGLVEA